MRTWCLRITGLCGISVRSGLAWVARDRVGALLVYRSFWGFLGSAWLTQCLMCLGMAGLCAERSMINWIMSDGMR